MFSRMGVLKYVCVIIHIFCLPSLTSCDGCEGYYDQGCICDSQLKEIFCAGLEVMELPTFPPGYTYLTELLRLENTGIYFLNNFNEGTWPSLKEIVLRKNIYMNCFLMIESLKENFKSLNIDSDCSENTDENGQLDASTQISFPLDPSDSTPLTQIPEQNEKITITVKVNRQKQTEITKTESSFIPTKYQAYEGTTPPKNGAEGYDSDEEKINLKTTTHTKPVKPSESLLQNPFNRSTDKETISPKYWIRSTSETNQITTPPNFNNTQDNRPLTEGKGTRLFSKAVLVGSLFSGLVMGLCGSLITLFICKKLLRKRGNDRERRIQAVVNIDDEFDVPLDIYGKLHLSIVIEWKTPSV